MKWLLLAIISLSLVQLSVQKECEVCINVLGQIQKTLTPQDKSLEQIEAKITQFCESATEDKDQRLCYAIDTTKREVSKPFQNGLPVEKICDRLKKKDAVICALQYPVKIDLSTIDAGSLRVKEIQKILGQYKKSCTGCIEKSDYVKALKELQAESSGTKQEL
eukprot:TRINITY_DN1396_c0_g1_i1.p1 TRINITY_DN1396_c0_g1~~TRINITY_DN1396_c0_g1_i1.p1  ORF type:complete len:163 (+),score=37.92 TRINITY_DN1396_c0_g1_i1:86-574(+)